MDIECKQDPLLGKENNAQETHLKEKSSDACCGSVTSRPFPGKPRDGSGERIDHHTGERLELPAGHFVS